MPFFRKSKSACRPMVVVADDNDDCLDQICGLVGDRFDVVGRAKNGLDCVDVVRRLQPAVAIVDISMPLLSGIETARQITRFCPDVRVIMLSIYDDPTFVEAAFAAGAAAYIFKLRAFDELLPAIDEVLVPVARSRPLRSMSR